ncbi:peptidoglycan DD-metalloendopeptidase family protein [Nocardioides sp.]|uniref:peptidoglycan DD-metalloendopeptidase family protein n=1 Tax=Nocardioides sp. TaxID=35761 RepID=UPI002C658462|nr:peptidoglycan DD-metalloendopeptidase family protein [Nocardioides sp.]HXH80263.1 peptidoglycan DD-metalloendopeptidase family protein [Nocardioides sp.]
MAAAAAAAALALGALAVPTSLDPAFADDLKDKQKRVEKEIHRAHDDVQESSKELRRAGARLDAAKTQLADARTALATAQGRLAVAQERDALMQAELAQAEAALALAQSELEQGQDVVDAQREIVGDTITRLYMEGDPDLMAFASLIDAESAQDLSRRAEINAVMVDTQTRDYDKLQASEVLLAVNEDHVEDARDDVALKREAAAENLLTMEALESEAAAAKTDVVTLVGERASAEDDAARARARDLRKLKEAERQKERIEEMLRKRAAAALRRAKAKAAALAAANAAAGSQAAMNARVGPTAGVLQMPVGGGLTSPFGYRTHPIYGYWGLHDGADFGGGCAQPIVAAESGVVISSYFSDVYGNRLIIDHGALAGAGVATIYNHASRYTVGDGTRVQRGEIIGYVGDTGWSTACHLHFTVMANGNAVNPADYF